jgi:hypothetical protein
VWVGGSYFVSATQTTYALIVHWNGTSWTQETTPDAKFPRINGMWGSSSGDLWAAGVAHAGGRYVGYVLHRVGDAWERIRTPRKADVARMLFDISGSSSTNIWMVGYDYDKTTKLATPLALRWNGASIERVPTPKLLKSSNQGFVGVTAVDETHAWAGGYLLNGDQALLERWDGTSWHVEPLRDHTGYEGIQGVDATSISNAYAVGYRNGHPTIRHWDGVSWTSAKPPWPSGVATEVTATTTHGIWVVGSSSNWEVVASTCS